MEVTQKGRQHGDDGPSQLSSTAHVIVWSCFTGYLVLNCLRKLFVTTMSDVGSDGHLTLAQLGLGKALAMGATVVTLVEWHGSTHG